MVESATNKDKENRARAGRRLHLREVSSDYDDYDGIGAELRAARTRNGQNLVDVANVLRIRLEFLEALEQGRFADLPAPVYAVGFIRTYAEYVGIDGEDAIRRFKVEAEGLAAQTRLSFPTPEEESRVPRGWLLLLAGISAALIYAGWYYAENKERLNIAGVPAVPARLAPKVVEEPTPVPTAQVVTAPAIAPQPAAEAVTETVAEPVAAPVTIVESDNTPVETTAPASGTTVAVAVEAVAPTVVEAVPEPAVETAVETAVEPVAEPAPEPVGQTVLGPVVEPVVEPVAEPASEPVTQIVAESVAEPVTAPVVQAVAETVAQAEPSDIQTAAAGGSSAQTLAPEVKLEDAVALTPSPDVAETQAASIPPEPAQPVVAVQSAPEPEVSQAPKAAIAAPALVAAAEPVATPARQPQPVQTVAVAPASTVEPTPPAKPATTAPVVPRSGRGTASEPQTFGLENQNTRVVLTARVDVWVQVSIAGGDTLLSRILRQGDKYMAPNREDIVLTTGNAGALTINVDGRDISPVGPPGAVRRDVSLSADHLLGVDTSENSRTNN